MVTFLGADQPSSAEQHARLWFISHTFHCIWCVKINCLFHKKVGVFIFPFINKLDLAVPQKYPNPPHERSLLVDIIIIIIPCSAPVGHWTAVVESKSSCIHYLLFLMGRTIVETVESETAPPAGHWAALVEEGE